MVPSQAYFFGKVIITSFWVIILIMNILTWKRCLSRTKVTKATRIYEIKETDGKIIPLNTKTVVVNFKQQSITMIPEDLGETEIAVPVVYYEEFKKTAKYLETMAA